MSTHSTLVTEEHFAYLAARTRGEDELLRSLRLAAEAAGIPAISIAPEQASLMQILLELARAKHVVEVGTLAGYSAIAMARALPDDGRVTTIEISETHAAFAREWIERSDVAGKIDVLVGPGADVLPGLEAASADALFLDADKSGYAGYLDEGMRIVRDGGMVLVDNAFAFGSLFADGDVEPSVSAIRSFNERMAGTAGLHGIIVPIGDGLWVAVKGSR